MTQGELAEAVGGVSHVQISHIESGRRDASLRLLSRICDVLGAPRGPFLRSEQEAFEAAVDNMRAAA